MAKVQEKHMEQLSDVHSDRHQITEKLALYEDKIKDFSTQIHSLNEEKLLLLKEHEIMKAKLRTFEIDSTLNRGNGTSGTSMFFDKMRGKIGIKSKNFVSRNLNVAFFFSTRQVEISGWKTKRANYSIIHIWMSCREDVGANR